MGAEAAAAAASDEAGAVESARVRRLFESLDGDGSGILSLRQLLVGLGVRSMSDGVRGALSELGFAPAASDASPAASDASPAASDASPQAS